MLIRGKFTTLYNQFRQTWMIILWNLLKIIYNTLPVFSLNDIELTIVLDKIEAACFWCRNRRCFFAHTWLSILLILRETQFWPEWKQATFSIKRNTVLDLIEGTYLKVKLNTVSAERNLLFLPKETQL